MTRTRLDRRPEKAPLVCSDSDVLKEAPCGDGRVGDNGQLHQVRRWDRFGTHHDCGGEGRDENGDNADTRHGALPHLKLRGRN